MSDDDIRRLVESEAERVADVRIKDALRDRHNISPDQITARLKSTRHENADHLDRALNLMKVKPGVEGSYAKSVGGDAVWDTTDLATQAELDAYIAAAALTYLKLDASNDPVTGDLIVGSDAARRAEIGALGATVYCGFAHENCFNTTDYALLQGGTSGDTYLNSKAGQSVTFRIGNATVATVSAIGLVVGNSAGNTGKWEIGTWQPSTTNAMIGHEALDQTAAGNYALVQGTAGSTFVNAASGQLVGFRINNATIAHIDATGLDMAAGMKATQNAAPTVGDDLVNKTHADKAGAIDWTTTGTCSVVDAKTISGGSGSWANQAYSRQRYVHGCHLAFRASQTDKAMMLGLNSDPTLDDSYTSLDYAFYMTNAGAIQIWESNVSVYASGSYTASTLFEIVHDGSFVRYYVDGVEVRSVARAIGSALYVDSSFLNATGTMTDIEFVPLAPRTGSSITVEPTGMIASVTELQATIVKLEQAIEDLRYEFEGHHH